MLYEALVEEIKRKAFIAKSMGQEFTDENYLEEIEKAMGRRAVMGEVRTWRGKEYIKTPKGWRPKPKGYKEGAKVKWRIKIRNMLVVRVDRLPVAGQPSQLPMNFRRYF